jgi:hypothetical protein
MHRRSRSIALVPLLLVLACGDGSSPLPPGVDPGTELTVTRLPATGRPFGYFSGLRQPVRTVVRTNKAWAEMWAAIHQPANPVPPAPAIDFATEMVIVVAMGEQRSTGYAITIERVSEAGDGGIDAIVRTRRPGDRCVVGAALTQPLDIVRVPRREGAVRFAEQDETYTC